MLDRRTEWAGLRKSVLVSFPQPTTSGNINLTTGSTLVVGNGTNWPVSDLTNCILPETVAAPGAMWVTPSPSPTAMQNITRNSTLYFDAAGPNPEFACVLDILGPRIYVNFQYPHAANFTCWQSSLSGLQLRNAGDITPIFTALCITSPTTLVMDQPWAQLSITGSSYQLALMYITIDPQLKGFVTATDPFQNIPLQLHKTQEDLNLIDPNRQATNSPVWLADRGPNPNGNGLIQYEPWPPITIPYQLNFYIKIQWPDMRIPSDYPPPVLNPNCMIWGALSQGFATQCGKPPDYKDPAYSLQNADRYAAMAEKAFLEAIEADEARVQTMFTSEPYAWYANMGANYEQAHAYDSEGNYLIP